MKTIYKTILAFILILGYGCESLDEVPFAFIGVENIYKNEADIDKALLGAYQPIFQDGVNDLWLFLTLSGPSENVTVRLKAGAQGRMASVNFIDSDPQGGMWNNYYRGINRANTVIETIPTVGLETSLEEQKIAEARFIRAYYYFNLAHMFGGVPLHLTSTTSFDDESVKKPRVTLEEVYAVVEEDLIYAESRLRPSWDASNLRRATSGAAKAFLGKLYLTMAGKPLEKDGMYEKAATKLAEIYGDYSLVPNYSDVFSINNENNPEIIFARPNITNIAGSGTVLTFFAGAPNTPFSFNGGQYQFALSEAFYDSFDAADERRDGSMLFAYTNRNGVDVEYKRSGAATPGLQFGGPRRPNGIPFNKLRDPEASTSPFDHGNDIIFMRYADVLLMLAEANNEAGNSAGALPFLNEVRNRAGLVNNITETNQDLLRDIIKQERKWELAGEYTEYFDLQRWGDLEASMAINPDAIQFNVVYEPKLELFPIPLSQLQTNPNLVQNPGY
ncbi:RagB/SusD family nutrient uptake outer membrane protein [Cellulophaga sp. Hel_I_12]|uniref:RagB/SusD family nutrient uptake outer membrane protein n=1 Tax=Cellulophaga sp. Hel_I_12 TaxID=1249972 RepID=UPI000646C07D|nr:RagB/SusD family nutrient uptake outer membrane protein [Cellulophaga sp. Hel_I_12]